MNPQMQQLLMMLYQSLQQQGGWGGGLPWGGGGGWGGQPGGYGGWQAPRIRRWREPVVDDPVMGQPAPMVTMTPPAAMPEPATALPAPADKFPEPVTSMPAPADKGMRRRYKPGIGGAIGGSFEPDFGPRRTLPGIDREPARREIDIRELDPKVWRMGRYIGPLKRPEPPMNIWEGLGPYERSIDEQNRLGQAGGFQPSGGGYR